jgi:hypothetical protein
VGRVPPTQLPCLWKNHDLPESKLLILIPINQSKFHLGRLIIRIILHDNMQVEMASRTFLDLRVFISPHLDLQAVWKL